MFLNEQMKPIDFHTQGENKKTVIYVTFRVTLSKTFLATKMIVDYAVIKCLYKMIVIKFLSELPQILNLKKKILKEIVSRHVLNVVPKFIYISMFHQVIMYCSR